jgi:K+-sensing histidine kinase KdpD
MTDGGATTLNAVVGAAILEADERASQRRFASPLARLQEVADRHRDDTIEIGKRVENLVSITKSAEKDAVLRAERDAEKIHTLVGALDERLSSLEQGLSIVVGAVVALGMGHSTPAQNDAWLKSFMGCKGSYERGLLGAQLLDAAAKLGK